MKYLTFAREVTRLRRATFEERSLFPLRAACVVANAVREDLSQASGARVDVRLSPPSIPPSCAWGALLENAAVHVVRGRFCDAAFVLRPTDAASLANLLFSEPACHARVRISRLETEIVRRAVARLAPALYPVCGEGSVDPAARLAELATYLEIHVTHPLSFCLGVALSKEPAPARTAALSPSHLMHSRVAAGVRIRLRSKSVRDVAALRAGEVLAGGFEPAMLAVKDHILARGACGIRGGRYAIEVAARA